MTDECTCEACGEPLTISAWPWCPHGTPSLKVIQDTIPGGQWIENLGPHPVKVESRSHKRDLMRAKGLREAVRHVGEPGSDKSRHTTRWT